jgi:preprotein translocase subunit SecD
MNFCARRFNLYLLLTLLLTLAAGCATDKKDKKTAVLRVHVESTANTPGNGEVISVLRSKPVLVTIAPDPVLTEANIVEAVILDTPGGFALQIKFDETGMWMLEQYSSANPGKHFAIMAQWGEKPVVSRWLAAPIITHRLGNGLLAFTPDADRDEVNQLVRGLNNNATKNRKGALK